MPRAHRIDLFSPWSLPQIQCCRRAAQAAAAAAQRRGNGGRHGGTKRISSSSTTPFDASTCSLKLKPATAPLPLQLPTDASCYAEKGRSGPANTYRAIGPGKEQSSSDTRRDGHGLGANVWTETVQKKRQGLGSGDACAHGPEVNSDEDDDSAPIAGRIEPVWKPGAASGTRSGSRRAVLSPRARLFARTLKLRL